jgi:hypothetical protein
MENGAVSVHREAFSGEYIEHSSQWNCEKHSPDSSEATTGQQRDH